MKSTPVKGLHVMNQTFSKRQIPPPTTNINAGEFELESAMLTAEHFLKEEDQKKSTFHGRSGSVNVDKSCLSCTGIPAHTMKMFKMACLSYKPSLVEYRSGKMHRSQLLTMRKTLIDKCEEVINSGKWTGKA